MNPVVSSHARVGGLLLVLVALAVAPLAAQNPPAEGPSLKAEEFYKNIQVLTGVPADQVTPAMYFIASSLGVGCGYCHGTSMDRSPDTPMKSMARRMIVMTTTLNKSAFGGGRSVTCYTCHRGAARPELVPLASAVAPAPVVGTPVTTAQLPTAESILDKHISAVGGAEALGKLTTFVSKGISTDINGATTPLELITRRPGFRLSVREGLKRDSPVALLGDHGWLVDRVSRIRPMRIDEVDAAKLEDDLWFPNELRSLVTDLRTRGTETIGGRTTYVVTGRTRVLPEVDLYFDTESGLLVRAVYYTEVTLGRYPTQFDIDAYLPVAGVRIPSRWTVSEILNRRVSYRIDEVEHDIPINADRFDKPSEPRADQ